MTPKEKLQQGEALEWKEFEAFSLEVKSAETLKKYTKLQAVAVVNKTLQGISLKKYEKISPYLTGEERRRDFYAYVQGYINATLWETLQRPEFKTLKTKELFALVDDYVDKVYPSPLHGKILQGALPNQIRQTGKNLPAYKEGALVLNRERLKIAFLHSENHGGVAMTVPTQKVLSMFYEELCRITPPCLTDLGTMTLDELDQYATVRISVDHYMELTGTKDKKTARKTIKEACARLFDMAFAVTVGDMEYKGRIFSTQGTPIRGGIFEMKFTSDYLRYCSTNNPAPFHRGMYKINGNNNPYSWALGAKLWQHFVLTRGQGGGERLSVKKLLEAVSDIPSYADVLATDRHIVERIVEPFERDIDELTALGVLSKWEYSNARGEALRREQLESMDFETWAALYVTYEIALPSQAKYVEARKLGGNLLPKGKKSK